MMNLSEFCKCLSNEINGLDDYEKRIKCINNFLSQKSEFKTGKYKYFYRGDKYCVPTQSKLFRNNQLESENKMFEEWQNHCCAECLNICNCEDKGSLKCLAYMQHYKGNTRLLDFTRDPLVALRFACGEDGDNCRKKVTVYVAESIDLSDGKNNKGQELMKLVKSDFRLDPDTRKITEDYFIEVGEDFPRIENQKGLFMFMGNRNSVSDENLLYSEKIKHELSPTHGRGKSYKGMVGVLNISPYAVEKIRRELEMKPNYKMAFLMDNEKTLRKNIRR